eukprot:scaffold122318_cov57-Phaeocystis_antarctica.AAC.1
MDTAAQAAISVFTGTMIFSRGLAGVSRNGPAASEKHELDRIAAHSTAFASRVSSEDQAAVPVRRPNSTQLTPKSSATRCA